MSVNEPTEAAGSPVRAKSSSDLRPRLIAGAVMAVVNTVTDQDKQESVQWELFAAFVLGCAVFLYAKGHALNLTTALVEDLLNRMRVRFADKIRRLDLAAYERIGRPRIYTALTRDVQTLSEAGTMIVHGASSAVMLSISIWSPTSRS